MTLVTLFGKSCNTIFIIERAVKRETLLDGEVAAKRRSRLGNADHFHVILSVDGVRHSLTDCSESIDCYFDAHSTAPNAVSSNPPASDDCL